jgi:hypothetical protein
MDNALTLRGSVAAGRSGAMGVFVSAALTLWCSCCRRQSFFRVAQHLLIGVVTSYAVVVAASGLDRAVVDAPA